MGKNGTAGLLKTKTNDPEIRQYFRMLELPTALLGYKKERVEDALLCLDRLYRNKIAEIKRDYERKLVFERSRVEQEDSRIPDKRTPVPMGREDGQTPTARAPGEAPEAVRQSLRRILDAAEERAQSICDRVRRQTEDILRGSRRQAEEDQKRHGQIMSEMAAAKRRYVERLGLVTRLLDQMREQARELLRKLEETPGA